MDRLSHITDRFTAHFESIGAIPVVTSLEDWALVEAMAQVDGQRNLRVSLGFRRADPSDHLARFCPELVALQTSHLKDREFHAYLDAMQFATDFETTVIANDGLDSEAATAAADLALSERAPGSLRLMTEVQMAWIDRQTAS